MPLPAEPSSKVPHVDARSSMCFGQRRSTKPILTPKTRLHAIKNINKIARAVKQHQQPPPEPWTGKGELSSLDRGWNRSIASTVCFSVSLPLQGVLLKSTSQGEKYCANSATTCTPIPGCSRQVQLKCKLNSVPQPDAVWGGGGGAWVKWQRQAGLRLWKGPGRQALLEKGQVSRFCAQKNCPLEKQVCKASNGRQDDSRKGALVCFVQANFNRTSTTSHRKLLHSPIHLSLSASFPDVWAIFFFSLASSNKSLNSSSPPLGCH